MKTKNARIEIRGLALFAVSLWLLLDNHSFAQQTNCTPRPSDLIAWWPGDGVAADMAGTNDGVLQNGATYAQGAVGQAFIFDGVDDRVAIAESPAIDLSRMSRWTIEAWAKPASFTNADYPTIYSEGSWAVSLGLNKGTGKLDSWVNNDHGALSSTPLELGQWSHVALVWNGTNRLFYINGVAAGSGSAPTISPDNGGSAIGDVAPTDATAHFAGEVDELALYNRALAASEIAAIYGAGSAGKCFTNNPSPLFVRPPVSQTVPAGITATFTGVAMGVPRPSYQWFFNGALLADATSPTLVLNGVRPDQAGVYALSASNSSGSVTSTCTLAVQYCSPTPSGAVAWWPADGFAVDVVGTNNGVLQNGAAYGPGEAGEAFSFDGVNDRVAIAESPGIDISRMSQWTIEAWVNPASFTNAPFPTIYSEGSWGASLGLNFGTGKLDSWINNSNEMTSTVALEINQLSHVALVCDRTSRTFYINGVFAGSSNAPPVLADNDGSAIGDVAPSDPAARFKGKIDEVTLYNRALSASEIAGIYAAGTLGKCFTNNPTPVFVLQPTDQTAALGESATLSGLAMGVPRPQYQWLLNGVPLANATDFTLAMTNLNLSQAGSYILVASNYYGSATSAPARLVVYPCLARPSGLVDWWPADGFALDVVGTNHGVAQNGATFAPGKVAQGFSLDGANDFIQAPRVVDGFTNFGFAFWMRLASFTHQYYMASFCQSESFAPSNSRGLAFYCGNAANSFGFYAVGQDGTVIDLRTTVPFGTGVWKHIAVTYDGVSAKQYVDGVLLNERAHAGITLSNSEPFLIGKGYAYPGGQLVTAYFSGQIDEVQIFNRGLSQAEVASLYAAGTNGICFTNDPAPVFVQQPVSQTALEARSVVFSGAAMGSPRPTYQWLFNGTPLSKGTNTALLLTNVALGQAGDYALVAGNLIGSATSLVAHLTVIEDFNLPGKVAATCTPKPPGLVAWWPGDGFAFDTVGSNHAVLLNGAHYATGKSGAAFSLDGVDDEVVVPHSSTLSLVQAVTLEAWVKSSGTPAYSGIIKKFSSNTGYEMNLNNDGTVRADFGYGSGYFTAFHSRPILDGAWHHVVATFDKVNAFIYVDGTPGSATSDSHSLAVNSASLVIGNDTEASGRQFNGVIDEVAVYNRALSPIEIALLYAAGSAGKCFTNDPAPVIFVQPASQTNLLHWTVSLAGAAMGTPRPTYQWLFNGVPLAGETAPSLVLTRIETNQSGSYVLVASNTFGTARSSPAAVTVNAYVTFVTNTMISADNTNYDGLDITLSGATVTIDGYHRFQNS